MGKGKQSPRPSSSCGRKLCGEGFPGPESDIEVSPSQRGQRTASKLLGELSGESSPCVSIGPQWRPERLNFQMPATKRGSSHLSLLCCFPISGRGYGGPDFEERPEGSGHCSQLECRSICVHGGGIHCASCVCCVLHYELSRRSRLPGSTPAPQPLLPSRGESSRRETRRQFE